jgi:hypothetical protein
MVKLAGKVGVIIFGNIIIKIPSVLLPPVRFAQLHEADLPHYFTD